MNNSETMEEKNISTLFEEMKGDVSNYLENKIKLIKLEALEKGSTSASKAGYGLILAIFILFGVIFGLITLAIYLASVLGGYLAGFGAVTGLLLLIVIIMLLARKSICGSVTNRIISKMMDEDKKIIKFK